MSFRSKREAVLLPLESQLCQLCIPSKKKEPLQGNMLSLVTLNEDAFCIEAGHTLVDSRSSGSLGY